MAITKTQKNLSLELKEINPDILVYVIPDYHPAFEQLMFKLQYKFPLLPTLYVTHHPWKNQDSDMYDLFIPRNNLVLCLSELTSSKFMYAVADAHTAISPHKT